MRDGWIKDHRCEIDSLIWEMPPMYHRVWQYLKYSAAFEVKKIPQKSGEILILNRGELITSIRTIANAVAWYERGILRTPNPKTIQDILQWMESQEMIKINHGNGGNQYSLISLLNWTRYQNDGKTAIEFKAESNDDETDKKQEVAQYKKVKKDNKEKQERKEENKYKDFEAFFEAYPRKVEKKKAYRAWKERIKEGVEPSDLISAALNYSLYVRDNKIADKYIKHPYSFLSCDRVYEEFLYYVPVIKGNDNISKNISNALQLVNDNREVSLW